MHQTRDSAILSVSKNLAGRIIFFNNDQTTPSRPDLSIALKMTPSVLFYSDKRLVSLRACLRIQRAAVVLNIIKKPGRLSF
jgi:hypothetical protein